jgi:hypothetical protein
MKYRLLMYPNESEAPKTPPEEDQAVVQALGVTKDTFE